MSDNLQQVRQMIGDAREFARRTHHVYAKGTPAGMGAEWARQLAAVLEVFVDEAERVIERRKRMKPLHLSVFCDIQDCPDCKQSEETAWP